MKDSTLGGYLREHERPPAFRGRDEESYTVEILTEPTDDDGAWSAYLFFLRWRGQEATGHLETDYLAHGGTEAEARAGLERLSLHEVKALLDDLIDG